MERTLRLEEDLIVSSCIEEVLLTKKNQRANRLYKEKR